MITMLAPDNTAWAEAVFAQSRIAGLRMEADYRLQSLNPRMPHRFYRVGTGALLQDSGGMARLCGTPEDPEELEAYLSFTKTPSLFSDGWVPSTWQQQPLLALVRSAAAQPLPPAAGFPAVETTPSMQEVMAVFAANHPEDSAADHSRIYADLCARRNHGLGCMYGIRSDGYLASVAGMFAITPSRAYLGGVETLPAHRSQGYASAMLQRLCHDFAGRDIYLLCGPSLFSFYAPLGFAPLPPCAAISHPPGNET